jgi:hypothetical protein
MRIDAGMGLDSATAFKMKFNELNSASSRFLGERLGRFAEMIHEEAAEEKEG